MRTRTSTQRAGRSGLGDGAHLSFVVQGGRFGVVQRCETTPGAVDQARVNARRLVRTPEDAVRTVAQRVAEGVRVQPRVAGLEGKAAEASSLPRRAENVGLGGMESLWRASQKCQGRV